MPFWVWVYVGLLTFAVSASAVSDWGGQRPAWFRVGEIVSGLSLTALVTGYWVDEIGDAIGLAALALLAFPLFWEPFSAWMAIRGEWLLPELEEDERRKVVPVSTGLAMLLLAPALYWGVKLLFRAAGY